MYYSECVRFCSASQPFSFLTAKKSEDTGSESESKDEKKTKTASEDSSSSSSDEKKNGDSKPASAALL